ncbi:MAG: 50S ribosomal protein L10 [Candidatus Micrarchaeota archaeon]|nr:50S ribosomal protein L10 [Candidatus Micrarchaeota archaeon]MDE1823816.1 50S ribosomal protein L10 [Candidatus Micrarchaeota archaeon]MDE1849495.1 50S ribosomal protein L10 [Candidatus Micrarchaeota archaeon]
MMLKAQKVEFVKKLKKEAKESKTIGIMPIDAVPDRLVQRLRNELKPKVKFVIARKSLIMRTLEGDERLSKLKDYADGNFALMLTDMEPTELNSLVKRNRMRLGAKPNQISPDDIHIESGETTIPPGQAVTDLKTAGIDVKIDKGKVVISKSKVLVTKGMKISTAIAKALKMLDIMPFETGTTLRVALNENILFTSGALGVDAIFVTNEITRSFGEANSLSLAIGFVTPYNADMLIRKGYLSALGLGLSAKIYEPGITDKLLANAVREALSIRPLIKEEAKEVKEEAKKEEPAK